MSRKLVQAVPELMSVLAVIMALFYVLMASFDTLTTMEQRCVHEDFALTLIFLAYALFSHVLPG